MRTQLTTPRRRYAIPALVTALALIVAACGDATEAPEDAGAEEVAEEEEAEAEADEEAADEGDPQAGGTVVFGADQEPAIINPFLQEGNLYATSVVTTPILMSLFRITPDLEYEPYLLADEPIVEEDPFRITYELHPDAIWSDGEPITAEDVEFTWERRVDPEVEVVSREGYDLVTDVEIVDDKTITFTFEVAYAPWRTLFSDQSGAILPKHLLEGEDINEVWRDEIPVASGPFVFEEWNQGVDLTLVRNENYWREPANLDRIVFRFLEDSSTQVQQLRGGEVDVLAPQAQIDLIEQVEEIGTVTIDVTSGTQWEKVSFVTEGTPVEPLYVRQAIAKAIDRAAIVEALIAPINPDATPLNSLLYTSSAPEYQPNWEDALAYDPEGAVALLEDNGCERDTDEVFICEGERLEIAYATTTGNERRELTFEIMQAQLADLGIALSADFSEASVLFGTRVWENDYEMAGWALTGRPDPVVSPSQWGCPDEERGTGTQNFTLFCEQEATDLMLEANLTADPDERAALINQADALLAETLLSFPMYESPVITLAGEHVRGVVTNPTSAGPTWNAAQWYRTDG